MNLSRTKIGAILAAPTVVYMVIFFVVPSLILFSYSFWSSESYRVVPDFVFTNYLDSLHSAVFWKVTINAVRIGLTTAAISLVLAVPVGYYLVYVSRSQTMLYLILITWFSSYLVRIYAWRTLLGTNGVLNAVLLQLGIVDHPVDAFLFSSFAVTITLVHIYLPFCILLVTSSLSEIKPDLIDAARDLGTSSLGAFFRVIAPNAANGLAGAFMLTFILVAGDYVTPQMLGGSSGQTTGLLIADQFRKTGNWPLGAAQAFVMFVISIALYFILVSLGRATGLIVKRRTINPKGI
ncbi:ABC transporter permease [Phyllobacterium endophyticum]|uniref:ABC transporter permease n=1 Tax=Phyllobacterium endophyticum TaxID=1149773 RepID=A0A2P7ASV9_9HYPH|nr:ABC transporter permease [Phyllobacterium endophyticum]MBB3236735.1 spermidine/putrescine transport system permease protein [Phyllobacterium endophyticum]PSH57280.1 ABC transporter permease [Phyllobacterium endophyticum]TYR39706.1 ABC transporter permease [Phyllobacterium endophyticum]